ncbi:hypothetical protein EX30DRAFT_398988 [Ascodesmis nigricans]|uniref:Peptide hydrolase n=1 Tax=Ascodesmis nigricans TaxID=341454 RepID=A0A4S2MIU6_9PEZI|nr:hypothetical protein EX30DRAFT_398988 [Ascodesmis nigricans]
MARSTLLRALSFRTTPVTLLTLITYLSISFALLWVHLVPPNVASNAELAAWDIDLPQAWADLQEITKEYRPYNARRNDEVREYLLAQIQAILKRNKDRGYDGSVEVIDDLETNVLFPGEAKDGLTVYYEGTNIIVHVHGSNPELSPVLINAHYDSVSTGYGATDDGKAVVSVLQVINAFTSPKRAGDKQIKRGLIALLNNGEEDYLNGARAYAVHPIANRSHTFLNLEGAGAGGRATLFRSTDTEVTRFYKQSKRPFGMIISGDGFKRGLVKSQTDYKVFVENLGMRGLDVAFWQPRSRYHTEDDDVRHTSRESLWHMLGSSLETIEAMTSDTSKQFDREGENPAGTGSDAVWFDFLGRVFAVFKLHTLFALTITLIVVPFVVFAFTIYGLAAASKLYYFSNTPLHPAPPPNSSKPTTTRGWRGLFRFPVAFVVASGATIGLAYLLEKINPMIAYSHQLSVYAMFISAWWSLLWFVMRGADAIRPTALGRGYAFLEQWLFWWAVMIFVAITINVQKLGSGYFVMFIYAGITLSAWISLLELAALPKKQYPGTTALGNGYTSDHDGHSIIAPSDAPHDASDDDHDPDESTPLFRGRDRPRTFHGYTRTNIGTTPMHTPSPSPPPSITSESDIYPGEQPWSSHLPPYTWLLQHLLSLPIPTIFTGSIMLFVSSALSQTGADGSNMLTVYLSMAILSIIFLLPATPFFHRISHKLTIIIFAAFIITLIFNLRAFPFNRSDRLKVYFQQSWTLTPGDDQGKAATHLVAHPDFIEKIVRDYIPSARNQLITAAEDPVRKGLTRVTWPGIPPNPAPETKIGEVMQVEVVPRKELGVGMMGVKVTARESRACRIDVLGEGKVGNVTVARGGAEGVKWLGDPGGPVKQVRLWRRSWEVEDKWDVRMRVVEPENEGEGSKSETAGLKLKVTCLWSDANHVEFAIPALNEVMKFLPEWAVVSKLSDGLVEGEWVGEVPMGV